jgi:putative ABC transport system ATP-binding protein
MIEAEGLRLSFRDSAGRPFVALDLAEFTAGAGVTVVRGPSGSGKSTLLYVLAGLQKPDAGRISLAGTSLYALSEARRDGWRRERVGFIFQDFHLVPELSPIANVMLPASFGRMRFDARARATDLLSAFGVPTERRSVDLLSRGERQRVALARALLFDPPVILADEPTASLDAVSSGEVIASFRRLAGEGRTIVVASHDPAVVAAADRVVTLDHGREAAA